MKLSDGLSALTTNGLRAALDGVSSTVVRVNIGIRLAVIGGFPGTGKSAVAGMLADDLRVPLLASDLIGNTIKAVLAEHAPTPVPSSVAFRAGYATLFELAEEFVRHGSSAVVDLSLGWRFQWEALDAIGARHANVRVLPFILECSRETSLNRLRQRHLDDPQRHPSADEFMRQPQLVAVEQLLARSTGRISIESTLSDRSPTCSRTFARRLRRRSKMSGDRSRPDDHRLQLTSELIKIARERNGCRPSEGRSNRARGPSRPEHLGQQCGRVLARSAASSFLLSQRPIRREPFAFLGSSWPSSPVVMSAGTTRLGGSDVGHNSGSFRKRGKR